METLNASEEFVYKVCKRSFLTLWSYANPQGKDPSKELCDILVVCEPDIFIFSVKEIRITDSGDASVDEARWRKRAIEASCKQIYGAERYLATATNVVRRDGTLGLQLPKTVSWRVHRIAVALGSEGKAPIQWGDFGKGFVHVFDEVSFAIILQELDTVSDFSDYLLAKEELYASNVALLIQGSEEDLLALYLHNGREFPKGPDAYVLDEDLWPSFSRKPEYLAKKAADADSYVWDRLIEGLCESSDTVHPEPGPTFTQEDRAVRVMARESRFNRRVLGKYVREFLQEAKNRKIRSRMLPSPSGIVYVFLYVTNGTDWRYMQAELGHRCFVARGLKSDCTTVIGVALEEWKPGGSQSTLLYLEMPNWTEEDTAHMQKTQEMLGYFVSPIKTQMHEDEYPESSLTAAESVRKVGRNDQCPCGSGKKYKRCHGK